MIQRRTQTDAYWQQFEPTSEDASRLYELILDEGTPVSMATLAQAVIERRCREEERLIEAELSKGRVYQPKEHYGVGEQIIFPALNYVLGTVIDTRSGRNPDYGEFTVLQVDFRDEDDIREFASELEGDHRLNREDSGLTLPEGQGLRSPAVLYEEYGSWVEEQLRPFLSEHESFVSYRDEWFLPGLMLEINVGHLHIAEALIEVRVMPLPTIEFLDELGLPKEVPEKVRRFSLNHAFDADERFDNVGDAGRDIWYLRRLTPEPVVSPPAHLRIEPTSYDRQDIDQELLLIEREIDDEGSGKDVMGPSRPIYRTTIALIYPHWRAGTLPLTVRTRGLFPQATTHHTPIVLIDGQEGRKMQGWVVHERSFVYGLSEWYEEHKLPVGAFIKLERTRDPRVITVDFEPRRLKRLWTPVATVKEGALAFQMRKEPIMCEYDELLAIAEDRTRVIDGLRTRIHGRGDSLLQIMIRLLPELTKLSPQGTVHAKTLYSAVNVLRRTPPGPIFALLSTERCFVAMGGGYWTFDEALV